MKARSIFDNTQTGSLATRQRRKRFELFLRLLDSLPKPVHILDVGGSEIYWVMMGIETWGGDQVKVTLLNLEPQKVTLPGFEAVVGDARDMRQFAVRQFDIVHSNSTIEHVGSYVDQKRMADEIRRVARAYFVQTPNRYFPVEPHFVFPFFQFLPEGWRAWMLQHFQMGWYPKIPDGQKALKEIQSIRMLTKKEITDLFTESVVFEEKIFGLPKSFIAIYPRTV